MIAFEGIPFIFISLVVAGGLLWIGIPYLSLALAILFFAFAGFCLFFFRDPHRKIIVHENTILSPADGKVLDIIDESSHWRVIIFLSLFNVHITRLPFSGKIEAIDYFKGKFLPAYREKASELNERLSLTISSPKLSYSLTLIAGVAARRIRLWIKKGNELNSGDKIGIMMFGSRAEVILPKKVDILVKKDDNVKGGLTFLGKLNIG